MSGLDRGTDRAGRRSKRFLSPSQKYEIYLQLVRQEATIAEAAAEQHVDRSTIMRSVPWRAEFHRDEFGTLRNIDSPALAIRAR